MMSVLVYSQSPSLVDMLHRIDELDVIPQLQVISSSYLFHSVVHVRLLFSTQCGKYMCCFALFVCLTLLASFFLPSNLSLKTCPYICVAYMKMQCIAH